ncbi:MAG: hypothetical protein WDN66_05435 [Candidatus Saccharibacteria bacterium]
MRPVNQSETAYSLNVYFSGYTIPIPLGIRRNITPGLSEMSPRIVEDVVGSAVNRTRECEEPYKKRVFLGRSLVRCSALQPKKKLSLRVVLANLEDGVDDLLGG